MKYNDRVRIKEWFYEGQEGTLEWEINYFSWTYRWEKVLEAKNYNILVDRKLITNIPENYLELIK